MFLEGLTTPQARQELVIRKALEMRREQWTKPGFIYQGAGDLLLRHGKFYSGRTLPAQYEHLQGAPSGCFGNALAAAKADPTLRYCEGVYAIGARHYTPHAWCLDPNGELLELTMPTDPESLGEGRDGELGVKVLPLEHWGYWGAVFHPEFAEAVFAAQDGQGLLDRPAEDALDGVERFGEWREDWHVLHLPYDPERTTL